MVEDVAFSPDGKTLALASREGTVQLWDVATGKLLETLKGHSSAVMAVAFSPDGRTLASGSSDQTVRLWNVETRRELMQLDPGSVELGQVCNHSRFPPTASTCWPEEATAPPSGPPRRSSGTIPTEPPKNCDFCCNRTPTSRAASGCCPRTSGCTKHWQSSTRTTCACKPPWPPRRPTGMPRARRGRRPSRRLIGWWPPIQPHPRPGCARPGCFAWRRPCCIRIGL